MDEEKVIELEWGAIPHELPACEDDGVVGDKESQNGFERHERGHSRRKNQRISGVAFGSYPYSVEGSPWREVTYSDGLNVVCGL